ncbi:MULTISPECIES: hypothetical protein [Catenuloplanes]|uniref:Uncharacterized protein n=1 Tax=Catenuloplanes niger TaxID=587534 RepID=A0AAE3ZQ77_9ACTN|nr:hypothetical protein [Catenuloplanes niger]MDR7323087.1 hypothetical protein [Catenuloplanes niger]
MDQLDALAEPAADLLHRVDDALHAHGAPTEHDLWPLLRRLGALTLPSVEAIIALRPAPLLAAGASLRQVAREYAEARDTIGTPQDWAGAGAEAFERYRAGLADHLAGDSASLAGHLAATADYTDALDSWITSSRTALASVLAASLASAEAVTLVTGAPDDEVATATAAAEIAARVLGVVAETVEAGEVLHAEWTERLADIGYREPADEPLPRPDGRVLRTRY